MALSLSTYHVTDFKLMFVPWCRRVAVSVNFFNRSAPASNRTCPNILGHLRLLRESCFMIGGSRVTWCGWHIRCSATTLVQWNYYVPAPIAGALSDDARLTSVAYIGPKSRTERSRKIKIGTEIAHVTRDSDTTFKVKRSKVNLQGAGAYCGGLPHSLFTSLYCSRYFSEINEQID